MDLTNFYKPSILRESDAIQHQFDHEGNRLVPKFVKFFKSFDPINDPSCSLEKHSEQNDIVKIVPYNKIEQIIINVVQKQHLDIYLKHSKFNLNTLRCYPLHKKSYLIMNSHDCVYHAIISYMLLWPREDLLEFGIESNCLEFVNFFFEELHTVNVFFHKKERIYFVKNSIKIFCKFFLKNNLYTDLAPAIQTKFKIISNSLKKKMEWFLEKLFSNTFTKTDIDFIETTDSNHIYKTLPKNNMKYITGQACVGKSTLLKHLEKENWIILSRSDIGTFAGKSKNAVEIANLHESLAYALTRKNVIGDRGSIDNPGWHFIMDNLEYASRKELIERCVFFFEKNFNEYSVLSYASQKVIIIIDLNAEMNRRRMFQRAESGDLQRARIWMYPYTQAFFYFVAAEIFGWKTFCVPYDKRENFSPGDYDNTVLKFIHDNFGVPILDFNSNLKVSKLCGEYESDHAFAKNCGVYK